VGAGGDGVHDETGDALLAAIRGAVREVDGGVELSVFCQPAAARSAVIGMHGGAVKVKVKAPSHGGKANEALLELLAGALGVPPRSLSLVSGQQSRNKRIRAEGVELPEAAGKLRQQVGGRE